MRLLTLLFAVLGLALAEQVSYNGHKVFRMEPTLEQIELLRFFSSRPEFDFWKEPRAKEGGPVDVMVAPEMVPEFQSYLQRHNIIFKTLHEDVQNKHTTMGCFYGKGFTKMVLVATGDRKLIDRERLEQLLAPRVSRGISFNRYYRFDEINAYLDELAAKYPNLVSVENIGKTTEGRNMNIIKVSSGGSGTRPVVLIDAGIHAREWIAPAMALYIIQQLVENNAANKELVDGVDWHILPVLNPDGYEYAHERERMWRKTRSNTPSSSCKGTDGNRNFGFHWNEVGASSWPCDETYSGTSAFSEPESRNLRDYTLSIKNRVKLYLTFHSYGEYLLYPWGFTSSLPSDWKVLDNLAQNADDAHVAAGGNRFSIGSSTNVLYPAAGGSDDWVKGEAGVALAYTVELTNTIYGFAYPPSQIQGYVTKFFEAVKVFGLHVKNNY